MSDGTEKTSAHGTGFATLPSMFSHELSKGHPESPTRLHAIQGMMHKTGLDLHVTPLGGHLDALETLALVHSKSHCDSVLTRPLLGDAALSAVGCVLRSVEAVCLGEVRNAFCAVRPPGHHANNNGAHHEGIAQGEGFCFFGNAALAARYAQTRFGLERVLIVDWDYHHGNGTQNAFYRDPSVLFFSTHNMFAYPGTGSPAHHGAGDGYGYNINVHLPPGSGDREVLEAFEEHLAPKAEEFRPELIIISAGFDARTQDPLGDLEITDTGFARLTSIVKTLADSNCDGKIVSLLEGGYNPAGLSSAVQHHLQSLME